MGLSPFDYLVMGICAWLGYRGFTTGLIQQLATLAFFVAVFFLMDHFRQPVQKLMVHLHLIKEELSLPATFLTLVLLALMTVFGFSRILSRMLRSAGLGFANRLGGFLFGVAKGALLCGIFLKTIYGLEWAQRPKTPQTLTDHCLHFSEMVFPFLLDLKNELHLAHPLPDAQRR
jgi:uncharacterized membrane protein required for colicin V production